MSPQTEHWREAKPHEWDAEAYAEGAIARIQGGRNPYPFVSPSGSCWQAGWNDQDETIEFHRAATERARSGSVGLERVLLANGAAEQALVPGVEAIEPSAAMIDRERRRREAKRRASADLGPLFDETVKAQASLF
jgi:hypothetical protein